MHKPHKISIDNTHQVMPTSKRVSVIIVANRLCAGIIMILLVRYLGCAMYCIMMNMMIVVPAGGRRVFLYARAKKQHAKGKK
jgi:hypothetical protein